MTAEEFVQLLHSRIALKNFAIPVKFRVLRCDWTKPRTVRWGILLRVPERETGEPTPLKFEYEWSESKLCFMDEDLVLRIVRVTLCEILRHEIDEAFHVDGARVFDPHRPT